MALSSGSGQMTSNTYTAPGSVTYNYAQLEGIWIQAGGPATAAPIAAAIAMAESGGTTTATNQDSNGTVDRGLWQINSVHGDTQSTYDVMGNARAAVAISNQGTNWSAWTTYNNGRYRAFLQTNCPPDTTAPINGTNAQANLLGAYGIPGAPTSIPDFLDPTGLFRDIFNLPQSASNQVDKYVASALQGMIISILNPFIQMVVGFMGITAGGAMVLIGIWMIAHNTETGQQVERTAGAAAQTGAGVVAPETAAVTEYTGAGARTITRERRPAGNVRIGGRSVQYRPARTRTTVARPDIPETLRTESRQYASRSNGAKDRSAELRPYGRGSKMGPPRPA